LDGARSAVRAAEVAVTTGDLALGGLHVDLMKIDVEGFEAEVLTGMPRTLDACHPKIIAECLTQEALQRLHRVTSDAGYRHAYHLMRDRLVPVGDRPFHPANYLFTVEPMTGRT
jgi:hypothetical protein